MVVNIEPETISELAEIPSVAAVKQANADLAQARHIVENTDLTCTRATTTSSTRSWSSAARAGSASARTSQATASGSWCGCSAPGDAAGAKRIHEELSPLFELDAIAVNPIPIKTALNMLGHEVGGFRLPLVEATGAEREAVGRDASLRAAPRSLAPAVRAPRSRLSQVTVCYKAGWARRS